MAKCFCVHREDEVELFLDVESGEYQFVTNGDNGTALHWASAAGQPGAVSTLLELNANPAPVDVDDATPIDYALQSGHQDCVQILEEKLGVSATSNGNVNIANANLANNTATDITRGKKNPLGFIVDFFRHKKARNSQIEVPDGSNVTSIECPNASGQQSSDNRNLNQRTIAGVGSRTLLQTDGEEVRLSTPRRQKESDVLKSIEKLHVSRTDNPKLQSQTPARHHPGHLPVLPDVSSHNADIQPAPDDEVDHSMLIRSPPPIFKRESSFPALVGDTGANAASGWARDHARLEQDAAQILAAQRADTRWSNYGATSSLATPKSLPPLPSISGKSSNCEAQTDLNDDVSVGRSKPVPLQLGPLKGVVPPIKTSQPTSPVVLNKPVEKLIRGSARLRGSGRSPTPPMWNFSRSESQDSSPSRSPTSVDSGSTRQRKRKKTRTPTSPSQLAKNSADSDSTEKQ